jgi:hypothetical protein
MTEKIIVCKYENGALASSSEVKRASTAFCNVEAFLREMQREILSGVRGGEMYAEDGIISTAYSENGLRWVFREEVKISAV